MGFSLGKKKGAISEINVTPFVDVMLVLLIIFMVTAPLMYSEINLSLPKTREVSPINLHSQQVILSYTQAGEYYLGNDRILESEILSMVVEKFEEYSTQVLFLRADYTLSYGEVARLMSFLRRGGISDIALVTEVEK